MGFRIWGLGLRVWFVGLGLRILWGFRVYSLLEGSWDVVGTYSWSSNPT